MSLARIRRIPQPKPKFFITFTEMIVEGVFELDDDALEAWRAKEGSSDG